MLGFLSPPASGTALPPGSRRVCWGLAVLDAGVAAWMSATGPWFDETSALTRVVTLGGHHVLLLWIAVAAVVTLLTSAVLTANFAVVGRGAAAVLTTAVGLSVVALAGLASLLALAVVVVGLVSVLGRSTRR